MKKLILIAATAFVSLASFANVDPVNGRVLGSFPHFICRCKKCSMEIT